MICAHQHRRIRAGYLQIDIYVKNQLIAKIRKEREKKTFKLSFNERHVFLHLRLPQTNPPLLSLPPQPLLALRPRHADLHRLSVHLRCYFLREIGEAQVPRTFEHVLPHPRVLMEWSYILSTLEDKDLGQSPLDTPKSVKGQQKLRD